MTVPVKKINWIYMTYLSLIVTVQTYSFGLTHRLNKIVFCFLVLFSQRVEKFGKHRTLNLEKERNTFIVIVCLLFLFVPYTFDIL